uniref:C-type lectin domain-containing protein n=1 Tax=Sinocyclocheilus rhinocerous TaxID=307959 RepID=A0A673HPV7_9TELE
MLKVYACTCVSLLTCISLTCFPIVDVILLHLFMNWMNAQKYCRQNYADLVNTVDQVDHNELLKTAGLGKFWLGLYRTTGNGVFVWLDQSRSSFTRWKLGQQENELCVRVYDGYWYDRDCDYSFSTISHLR